MTEIVKYKKEKLSKFCLFFKIKYSISNAWVPVYSLIYFLKIYHDGISGILVIQT